MRHLSSLLIILGLFIVFTILGQAFVLLSLSVWYGVSPDSETIKKLVDIQRLLTHSDGTGIIFYMQGVTAVFGLILSSWIYRQYFDQKPIAPLNTAPLTISAVSLVVLLMVVIIPLVSWLVWWNVQIKLPFYLADFEKWAMEKEQGVQEMIHVLTLFPTIWTFLMAVFVVGIIPAVGEEYWFRGVLQNKFKDMLSPHAAIWLTGFIFSALHFQFYGFFPRWLLGVLFGYLYWWSGNLWTTIIAHFVNNFLTLLAIYLYRRGVLSFNFYEPSEVPIYMVLLSMLCVAGILYYYERFYNHQRK